MTQVVQQMNTKLVCLEDQVLRWEDKVRNNGESIRQVTKENRATAEYKGDQRYIQNEVTTDDRVVLLGEERITKTGKTVRKGISLDTQRKAMWTQTGIISVTLDDTHCVTLGDYWQLYKTRWGRLELVEGNKWRKDIKVYTEDGIVRKNAAQQWWSRRNHFFKYMLEKTETVGEKRALELANEEYERANRTSEVKISLLERTFRAKTSIKRKPTREQIKRRNEIIRQVISET